MQLLTKLADQYFNNNQRNTYAALFAASIIIAVIAPHNNTIALCLLLALLLNPFNPEQEWYAKPSYQKAWFCLHALALFIAL